MKVSILCKICPPAVNFLNAYSEKKHQGPRKGIKSDAMDSRFTMTKASANVAIVLVISKVLKESQKCLGHIAAKQYSIGL